MSFGVKTKFCMVVPVSRAVLGFSQVKVPSTEAAPPLSVDEPRVWPAAMGVAVGLVRMLGVAATTVTSNSVVKAL